MIDVDLPRPPSANNLFANAIKVNYQHAKRSRNKTKGRVLTKTYGSWRDEAGKMMLAYRACGRARALKGPVVVTITHRECPRAGDLDNYTKPLIDLLVWMAFIPDDSRFYVRRIVQDWGHVKGFDVRLRVEPYEAMSEREQDHQAGRPRLGEPAPHQGAHQPDSLYPICCTLVHGRGSPHRHSCPPGGLGGWGHRPVDDVPAATDRQVLDVVSLSPLMVVRTLSERQDSPGRA